MQNIEELTEDHIKFLKIFNFIKNHDNMKKIAEDLETAEANSKDDENLVKLNEQIKTEAQAIYKISLNTKIASMMLSPQRKRIRIYMDGVFDIIHSGHFNALRQGKRFGHTLIVGINSDADVVKAKGPSLMNVKERGSLVEACKWVDEVVLDTPYTPTIELLDELNIDYVAHGDDPCYNELGEDVYSEMKKQNRFKMFKRTEGISTTEIIGRLLMLSKGSTSRSSSDNKTMTSSNLLKAVADDTFDKGPVVSSFLTTGWRLHEFCNNRVPKDGDKVVYIDGAFDILHPGHIETLKKAQSMGDFLYVGVHDDATINFHRGKNYPILNMQERVFNLLALKYVDDVVIAAPWGITEDLIKSLKITLVVHGSEAKFDSDYQVKSEQDDPFAVPRKLGIFQQIESVYDMTSEVLVKRLIDNRDKYVKKFQSKSEKEKNYYQTKEYVNEI